MSVIWCAMVLISVMCGALQGTGAALSAAVLEGAQAGVSLALSLAGGLCLWSGVAAVMERIGLTAALAKLLDPVLGRIFPTTRRDPILAGALSGNVCANLLGLGNAATPMGVAAAKRLARSGTAGDELCRLIVLNTASIQLIPATVASVRAGLGCATPFDILPAVWVTSALSAGLGLAAAWALGRVWPSE